MSQEKLRAVESKQKGIPPPFDQCVCVLFPIGGLGVKVVNHLIQIFVSLEQCHFLGAQVSTPRDLLWS